MKYNGIVIADLHVGVMDLNKFHEEFNGILISEIQKMKKLDFLIQEMNREINTVASKANSAGAAQIVVDVKSEIEKIREQIQNIE